MGGGGGVMLMATKRQRKTAEEEEKDGHSGGGQVTRDEDKARWGRGQRQDDAVMAGVRGWCIGNNITNCLNTSLWYLIYVGNCRQKYLPETMIKIVFL